MLYPSHYEIGVKLVFVWLGHCQNHTHQLKNHASIFHQSYSVYILKINLWQELYVKEDVVTNDHVTFVIYECHLPNAYLIL
jgi:hypothetical protein